MLKILLDNFGNLFGGTIGIMLVGGFFVVYRQYKAGLAAQKQIELQKREVELQDEIRKDHYIVDNSPINELVELENKRFRESDKDKK